MKLHLTPAHNRLLAVLLLLLAIGAAAAAVAVPAWWLHQRYDQFLEDYSDRLQRYQRIAALRPTIEEATRSAEQRDSRRYYLKGTSPTLAAAELQGLVTRIIDAHQGRIMSSQVLPSKDEGKTGGALKVAISVQMGAPIIPLQMILHALESHEPYLFVDQLTVRANQGRTYKPIPGVQPDYVVQLTVHAYAATPGGRP